MTNTIAVSVLCIAVAGVGAQWLAWRLRLPAIVLLFAVGLVVGPGLQILLPTQMFGNSVRPLVSLAVAIVVFEGGLALEFRELGAAGEGVLQLSGTRVTDQLCARHESLRIFSAVWGGESPSCSARSRS